MTAPAVITDTTRERALATSIPDVSFLGALQHPVYKEFHKVWELLERRQRGGHQVVDTELFAFKHEKGKDSEGLKRRRAMAVYQNFPDIFCTTTVGHLMSQAPGPDGRGLSYGTMGNVRRKDEVRGERSRAELVHYNTDGVGNDGSQWPQFWAREARRAMGTGHRWVLTEAPNVPNVPGRRRTALDEQRGARPYLVGLSPRAVEDWEYQDGQLGYSIVRMLDRRTRIVGGQLQDTGKEAGFYLMVAQNFTGFGDYFAQGGWWRFDPRRELMRRLDGSPMLGTWEATAGEIPLSPLFYMRDEGTLDCPAFSRSAIYELSQLAISDMNMESAADHDAWAAAMSLLFLLGVTPEQYNTAVDKMEDGSLFIPVPMSNALDGKTPQVYDSSAGAVAAEVFNSRAESRVKKFREITSMEASSTPDASGVSKAVGFAEAQGPKLALFASELEQAQNAHLRWLEMRFGAAGPRANGREPEAVTTWPRQFDLEAYSTRLREMLDLMRLAGATSPTFVGPALRAAGERLGLLTDDKVSKTVEGELGQSVKDAAEQMKQDRAALAGAGGGA